MSLQNPTDGEPVVEGTKRRNNRDSSGDLHHALYSKSISRGTSPPALSSIPERGSSRHMNSELSVLSAASHALSPPQSAHATPRTNTNIQSKGASSSPIRRPDVTNLRRPPSRTFVPAAPPTDLLGAPTLTHSRISLTIRLSSPVFMGGATVEGELIVTIDGGNVEKRRKPKQTLSLDGGSVTLIGIERCKGRQEIFRVLTNHIIDEAHPPPDSMVSSAGFDGSWIVAPSESVLPFRLDLPVSMGPPPYKSKKVGIGYWLSASLQYNTSGKDFTIRQSREIVVLTVHDPEKALVNLRHPLSVSDELNLSKKFNTQVIKLTAGLHRQTWISGYPVFIDIHIENRSGKDVRRIEVQLEKAVLYHNYSAPSAGARVTDVLRVPDHMQKEIIATTQIADGFRGIRALSQDFRTCQIQLPTGLVSIETGRFFGIRFFIIVQITCSFSKHLKVQLPISIVHPNSIDIPPNALAQVAASIEYKHRNVVSADGAGSGSPYRYTAGQAFKAARRRSYLQLRKDTIGSAEMNEVTRMLEGSPRKMANRLNASPQKAKRVTRRQSSAVLGGSKEHHRVDSYQALIQRPSTSYGNSRSNTRSSYETVRPLNHRRSFAPGAARSSLETRVISAMRIERASLDAGPRLQRSTSGLGFDDSSMEVQASSG